MRKTTKPKIYHCTCGAMNELSKVEHGSDWQISYAIVKCGKSGKVREFGKHRGRIFEKMIGRVEK